MSEVNVIAGGVTAAKGFSAASAAAEIKYKNRRESILIMEEVRNLIWIQSLIQGKERL